VDQLDRIILLYKSTTHATLHRATSESFITPFLKGSAILYPAYMSTSTFAENIERHWAGIGSDVPAQLTIECESGTPMAPMEANPAFGGHETEVLLGRNGVFEVLERRETSNPHEIVQIMGPYYARGKSKLVRYNVRLTEYASA
jgi:hypothetical protein